MQLLQVFAGLSLASIAVASPLHSRRNATSPCAAVSASAAAQAVATPTVPAQLAYDCITSVPFNKSAALALLDSMVPYIKWQSTTVYLKDPPEEYAEKVQPPVDIYGELDTIKSKAEGNEYDNEFEFGWELYRLFQTTHDGHFVYVPDSVGTVFNWARPVPLVSVSEDGKSLPKPYAYPDILATQLGNASFTSSAIKTINGKDALEYLEDWAQFGSLQDRDALYNNVFYELATVSQDATGTAMGTFAGGGRGRWVYPGATTEFVFENGTKASYTNFARVLVPLTGVTDGESLYQTWFTAAKPLLTSTSTTTSSNSSVPTSSAAATAQATPAPGYPPPVVKQANNLIGGYYLTDDYSDVAVLSVPSFVGLDTAEISFQQVSEQFLAAAKAAGKTKLVVDLSANGGGTILQGYDLFKQLFPAIEAYAAADRFRAFESTNIIGEVFSAVSETLPRTLDTSNETLYELEADVVSSAFNYQTDLTVNGTNFPSWPAKFGPVPNHGDNFTNLFRWNLSDVLTPYNSGGIYIHGYGNLTNGTQPFAVQDVVVVTDGYCASTCTIFSELMRQKANVKYISLGGRSKPGITQAIGGVKGTNDLPWDYIQSLAQYTVNNLSTPTEGAALNKTELGEYWSTTPFDRLAIGSAINVNFRDGIRKGDTSGTPLQFVYEAADCRILYTPEMTVDVTAIWKAVADSTWGSTNWCIAGSLGGGYGKPAGEKRWADKALSRRMSMRKRGLNIEDYPLDVYTANKKIYAGDGIMFP